MEKKQSDILLVQDKKKRKIRAVKEIRENGKMETVEPTSGNRSQFMRVDEHSDFFSNFFSNFLSQLKNPTNFSFFKVPEQSAVKKAQEMQKQIEKPIPESKRITEKHEVGTKTKQDHKRKNQNSMPTTETTTTTEQYRFKPEQINWEMMSNLGLSREYLEKRNLLKPLLKGYKTNELVPIGVNLGGTILRTDARLSLQQVDDGKATVRIHGIRKEPNLHFNFFGHKFTDEDKKNLLETGNMGRVVNLTNSKTGELMPSIISIDRLTNDIIALRTDFMKIPNEIKGVKLSEPQKQTLREGKPLKLEGMTSSKGTIFSAIIQYNAEKRYPEFLFDRNSYRQRQRIQQNNDQSQSQEVPKTFRGKELTDKQYNGLKAGQTVYVSGLRDKKGQSYQGYITFNKETGKTSFQFPGQVELHTQAKSIKANKDQATPDLKRETSKGTKDINKPSSNLEQSSKNKKRPKAHKILTKSKGRKM